MELIAGIAIGFLLGVLLTSVSLRMQRLVQASFTAGKQLTEMDSSMRERETYS